MAVVAEGAMAQAADSQEPAAAGAPQAWNWHIQNTDILQYHPSFPAEYSGPNSLHSDGELKETVSLDFYGGARLWPGAEAYLDLLMWQGLGFSDTRGIEAFPNGEAFRLGDMVPNVNFSRIFLRQTIGLGADEEAVGDAALQLAGPQPLPRLTITLGRFSAKDVFDNNAYANDSRTQFMNWAFMANEAWDSEKQGWHDRIAGTVVLKLPRGTPLVCI